MGRAPRDDIQTVFFKLEGWKTDTYSRGCLDNFGVSGAGYAPALEVRVNFVTPVGPARQV